MIKLKKKKFYEEEMPSSQIAEAETLIDESNCRKVYEAPDTQEKLFSLFYGDKKIEGLKEYFEFLDENVLGQNEIAPDIPVLRQHVVLTVENFDALEPKKSDDALSPKKIDSLA